MSSRGPLLMMELAFRLRSVGAEVCWITNQKPSETDEVVLSLEHKMLGRGVQVFSVKGLEAVDRALKADSVVLNTAVAGKWLDAVLEEKVPRVLPKVFFFIGNEEWSRGQLTCTTGSLQSPTNLC